MYEAEQSAYVPLYTTRRRCMDNDNDDNDNDIVMLTVLIIINVYLKVFYVMATCPV